MSCAVDQSHRYIGVFTVDKPEVQKLDVEKDEVEEQAVIYDDMAVDQRTFFPKNTWRIEIEAISSEDHYGTQVESVSVDTGTVDNAELTTENT